MKNMTSKEKTTVKNLISIIFVMTVYSLVSDKPETKNTGLFIFTFLFSLYLLISLQKKIDPFKNKQSTKYIYTLIFGGFLFKYLVGKTVFFFLEKKGISNTLNQKMIDFVLDKHPKEFLQIKITQIILSPIGEEILFRSLLLMLIIISVKYFKFKEKYGYIIFVIVSSLFFGLGHSFDTLWTTIPYIVSGIIFSVSYIYSKSIYVPVGIHILTNGIYSITSGKTVDIVTPMLILTILVGIIEFTKYTKNEKIRKYID